MSVFTLTVDGVYGGSPKYVDCHANGKKLAYVDTTLKDFDLYVAQNTSQTSYTVATAVPLQSGDIFDVTIFPQVCNVDTQGLAKGNVFQYFTMDSPWATVSSTNPAISSGVVTTAYVGIGTNIPSTCNLTVVGDVAVHQTLYARQMEMVRAPYPSSYSVPVRPIRFMQLLVAPATTFVINANGLYAATEMDAEVYLNGVKHTPVHPSAYYTLATTYPTAITTQFTISLTGISPIATDVMDITLWPTLV